MSESSDRDEVLSVNKIFYEALGRRDLELMSTIWIKDSRAGCVHPGWIMLQGWEAIRQSWENVFDPRDQLSIRLSNVTVDVKGDAAWVTCIQEIVYMKRDPVMMNVSQSTNIFERQDGRWLMVLHHASPIPVTYEEPEEMKLQ